MSTPASNRVKDQALAELIEKHRTNKIVDLPTDTQVIFGLICLIVDIKYKNRYGMSFEHKEGRGYKMNAANETGSCHE